MVRCPRCSHWLTVALPKSAISCPRGPKCSKHFDKCGPLYFVYELDLMAPDGYVHGFTMDGTEAWHDETSRRSFKYIKPVSISFPFEVSVMSASNSNPQNRVSVSPPATHDDPPASPTWYRRLLSFGLGSKLTKIIATILVVLGVVASHWSTITSTVGSWRDSIANPLAANRYGDSHAQIRETIRNLEAQSDVVLKASKQLTPANANDPLFGIVTVEERVLDWLKANDAAVAQLKLLGPINFK